MKFELGNTNFNISRMSPTKVMVVFGFDDELTASLFEREVTRGLLDGEVLITTSGGFQHPPPLPIREQLRGWWGRRPWR